MTALARTSNNCKGQIRLLFKERPTTTNPQLSESNKNVVLGPRWGLTPRETGRMTVDRNITLTLTMVESVENFSCEEWEARNRGLVKFGNPEGERPPLEVTTKQRLVKTGKTLCVL
jgi:hypothetical protein